MIFGGNTDINYERKSSSIDILANILFFFFFFFAIIPQTWTKVYNRGRIYYS